MRRSVSGVGYNLRGWDADGEADSLIVDTGSSNTWVGADKKYSKSSTSKDTGSGVSVSYGSGYFSGEEYTDKVTITSGLVIDSQSIGVADTASGFTGYDGILGIGPTSLTQGERYRDSQQGSAR